MSVDADEVGRGCQQVLRTTPSSYWDENPLLIVLGRVPRLSDRERLDAPKRNLFGEIIPQIEMVRANLRRLKRGWG